MIDARISIDAFVVFAVVFRLGRKSYKNSDFPPHLQARGRKASVCGRMRAAGALFGCSIEKNTC